MSLLLNLNLFYSLFYFNSEQVNAGCKMLYSLPYMQKQSSRGVFEKDVLRIFSQITGEHPSKSDFNFIEITLLRGYSSVNMLHICSKTPFLEITSGELLLCVVLNIELKNTEDLSKQIKKLFEIDFNIINTLSNFLRNFRLMAQS